MRYASLLALALVGIGCSRGPEAPAEPNASGPSPTATVTAPLTPEAMAKTIEVPIYPNAKVPDGMSRVPVKDRDGNTHYELVMTTSDPVDRVIDFYATKLKQQPADFQGAKSIIGKTPKGNDLILTVGPEAGQTIIRAKAIVYEKK